MNRWMIALSCLAWVVTTRSVEADPVTYTGRVIDAAGKPVAGVEVGSYWLADSKGMTLYRGVRTDADGRFRIVVESFRRPITLMAMSADRKLGGRVVVVPRTQIDGFEIKLVPLVRVHGGYSCPMPDHPVRYGEVLAFAGENGWPKGGLPAKVAQTRFSDDELKPGEKQPPPYFELRLPPGQYFFNFYEATDPEEHEQASRSVTIKADQAGLDLDLGTIELKPSRLVKGYGKEAPPLKIKDARGIARDLKLADFKGKWVILEFWSYGCGPCISRGLPQMVDFAEEHAVDRDKFVILAVHNDSVADFAELDAKLVSTVKNLWNGKPLPLPIVLDDGGQTFESYGITSIPAVVLINPDGKLVRSDIEDLESRLTPIPLDRKIARRLDFPVDLGIDLGGISLESMLQIFMGSARLPITLDENSGVKPETIIPLAIEARISLRSLLDLTLDPLGLVAIPGDDGLVIKKAGPDHRLDPTPSIAQGRAAERIAAKLDSKVTFDFTGATLAEVARHVAEETQEGFVIDPAARLAGRLDPKTTVTGSARDLPLKEALKALLGPIGVEAVIRDELVILRRVRP